MIVMMMTTFAEVVAVVEHMANRDVHLSVGVRGELTILKTRVASLQLPPGLFSFFIVRFICSFAYSLLYLDFWACVCVLFF